MLWTIFCHNCWCYGCSGIVSFPTPPSAATFTWLLVIARVVVVPHSALIQGRTPV